MQTALADDIRATPAGREADAILRACVHCGFCNATCPTYQLLNDELDGPRGRIYLIKQMLEGSTVTRHTLTHLDRCLTCRNCETTCPSGVQYGRLVDIGRALIEPRVRRPWYERLRRWVLRKTIPYPARFTPWLRLGRRVRPLLPGVFKRSIPEFQQASAWPAPRHARTMLVLQGCVQPALAPQINAAAARVLDRLGISVSAAAGAGCCGAASHHTSGVNEGLDLARRNIDAWWPEIEAGAEAIVMTASGCGVHVKDYGHLLGQDPVYAAKAKRVAELTRDLSEILANENLSVLKPAIPGTKIAFHAPCTLQHGQRLTGVVERILRDAGFVLTPVPDAHLCCGSAGTYSLLQPALARRLRENKIQSLQSGDPDLMVTANIGCLAHLQGGTGKSLRHWIEVMDGNAGR
jgi:glycolate oxidase iron-sulfur subunit